MSAKLVHPIWRNDLLPVVTVTATYADGTAVDLTAATSPKFHMRLVGSSTLKVDEAATIESPATAGRLSYSWAGTDTDTAGRYQAEFEVILDGKRLTFPGPDQTLEIVVREDIA